MGTRHYALLLLVGVMMFAGARKARKVALFDCTTKVEKHWKCEACQRTIRNDVAQSTIDIRCTHDGKVYHGLLTEMLLGAPRRLRCSGRDLIEVFPPALHRQPVTRIRNFHKWEPLIRLPWARSCFLRMGSLAVHLLIPPDPRHCDCYTSRTVWLFLQCPASFHFLQDCIVAIIRLLLSPLTCDADSPS